MKQGPPLRRKAPLRAQQAALERRAPLRQGVKGLKPHATVREPESKAACDAREAWHKVPFHAPCAACGQPVRGAPPHHCVPKQALKRAAKTRGIPPSVLLWDVRCRTVVCAGCHAAHENAKPRLPLSALSAANLTFASAVGLERYVGPRYYR